MCIRDSAGSGATLALVPPSGLLVPLLLNRIATVVIPPARLAASASAVTLTARVYEFVPLASRIPISRAS